jgi:hypothetical protein
MVKALLQLPSLDTVKGFVAVGRRMSVSLALTIYASPNRR